MYKRIRVPAMNLQPLLAPFLVCPSASLSEEGLTSARATHYHRWKGDVVTNDWRTLSRAWVAFKA